MRKLVRPRQSPRGGPCGKTSTVNDVEFVHLLKEKLVEEALEAERAQTVSELTEELGDILEVIWELASLLKVDPMLAADEKRDKYGGFDERLVWEV